MVWVYYILYIYNIYYIYIYVCVCVFSVCVCVWVKHNKLEDFNSLLSFNVDDFTPSGTLCYFKEKVDPKLVTMMPTTT